MSDTPTLLHAWLKYMPTPYDGLKGAECCNWTVLLWDKEAGLAAGAPLGLALAKRAWHVKWDEIEL